MAQLSISSFFAIYSSDGIKHRKQSSHEHHLSLAIHSYLSLLPSFILSFILLQSELWQIITNGRNKQTICTGTVQKTTDGGKAGRREGGKAEGRSGVVEGAGFITPLSIAKK